MTNRHVAEIFSNGLGDKSITFKTGLSAGFDLKRERGGGQGFVLKVTRVLLDPPLLGLRRDRGRGTSVDRKATFALR